ncbi:hypothetical protein [Streptomyces sp. NRRL F-5123]|uniref:hypothetical protein n=1 Tax=Streptomyces sp. NRRL F-5123 TaxID=1463856 RepID=UPI0004E1317A|nr:hypothetical protein [Streptomyces sp. NRRL F-5123]
MRMRAKAVAGAVALAAVAVTGCGGSGGSGADDTLRTELGRITDTAGHRAWVDFGDLRAQREAGLTGSGPAASQLGGHGWGEVAPSALLTRKSFGFDGRKADLAVEAGNPPDTGGRFDGGVDPAAVTPKVQALGGEPEKDGPAGKTWRLQQDHKISMTGPLADTFTGASVGHFNLVRTGGSSLVHASSLAALDGVDADGGRTLGSDAGFTAVAECLDHPLAAELTDHGTGDTEAAADGTVLGVGTRGTSATSLTNELCRTNPSASAANALAARLRTQLASGRSPSADEPWSQLLTGTKVTVDGGPQHVVRLTGRPADGRGDVLMQALATGDLAPLLGT